MTVRSRFQPTSGSAATSASTTVPANADPTSLMADPQPSAAPAPAPAPAPTRATRTPPLRSGAIQTGAQCVALLPTTPDYLAACGPRMTQQWVAYHPMAHVSALPQDVFWRFGLGWDGEFVFSMLEPWEAWFFSTFMLILAVLLIHSFTYLPGTISYFVRRATYYATGTEH